MRLVLVLGLAAVVLGGCSAPQGATGPAADRALTFQRIEGCTSDQAAERYVVVKGQAEWEQLWRASCEAGGAALVGDPGSRGPPPVNFTSQHVVAAFWGQKSTGGFGIQVTNITERADHVAIRVARVAPGPACFTTQALTYPADLVVTQPVTREARFQFDDRTQDC